MILSAVGQTEWLAYLEPLGTIWIAAIRMTVIPLIVSLIVVGIAGVRSEEVLGRLGVRSIVVFVAVLSITAVVIALIAPWFFGPIRIDPATIAELRRDAATAAPPAGGASIRDWVLTIVPQNPIRAAVDTALLPLFVFALLFGLALRRTSESGVVLRILDGVKQASMVLVGWVLLAAPVGVFALAAALGARLGATAAGAIGYYIFVMCALHVFTGLAMYPLAALFGRVGLFDFAAAIGKVQIVAITTRSSVACLPAMYDAARRLRIPTEVSGFVLPLALTSFRLSSPVNWPVGALFIGALYGVHLGPGELAIIALASVLLNPASPAIPSGGLFVQAPVYAAVGLPVEGLGILIALDAIPDVFKTLLNVTADMSVLTVITPKSAMNVVEAAPALAYGADD